MSAPSAPPPAVRLRISCASLAHFRATHERRFHAEGVFIPAGRILPRPVGTRVRLELELADRTVAYSGAAVVSAHLTEPARAGFVLRPVPPRADGDGVAGVERRAPASRPLARRAAVALALAAALLGAAAGGVALLRAQRRAAVLDAAFCDAIRVADDRLRAGRLWAPAGDSALDHLLAARALRPGDSRVLTRLEMMADTFESLGRRAVARGDLQEAAAHLSGAVRADPGRDWVRAELERVESRRRAEEARRRQGGPRGVGASG